MCFNDFQSISGGFKGVSGGLKGARGFSGVLIWAFQRVSGPPYKFDESRQGVSWAFRKIEERDRTSH